MPTLTIDEVQSQLPQLIEQLRPDEELVITCGDRAVARLLLPRVQAQVALRSIEPMSFVPHSVGPADPKSTHRREELYGEDGR